MNSNHHELASAVYKRFIEHVLIGGVFSDAERDLASGQLGETAAKGVKAGTRQDIRASYMSVVSGKGGWVEDAELRAKYARYTNVSLIDHLTSVVRGALMFGALDMAGAGFSEGEITPRLATIAAVAFCHDVDKALGIPRLIDLVPSQIADFVSRYHIDDFLAEYGTAFTSEQMLALISAVERTRDGYIRQGMDMSKAFRVAYMDCAYVHLADAMDSLFLNSDKGLDAALEKIREMVESQTLKSDAIAKGWRVIKLDDPNSPFLLDSLQYAISNECHELNGYPPLVEVHHGGRLTCVIPSENSDQVLSSAFSSVASKIGGKIRVDVNAKGSIDILDAPGDLDGLRAAIEQTLSQTDREKLLQVRVGFKSSYAAEIDSLLARFGSLPRWPDTKVHKGKLVPMWANIGSDENLGEFHRLACLIVTLLACVDAKPNTGIVQAAARESELVAELVGNGVIETVPSWLASEKQSDRFPVLAALAAAAALRDENLEGRLTKTGGLLDGWLRGSADRKGLVSKIDVSIGGLSTSLVRHFEALVSGKTVVAEDEAASGRCHFTNMPISTKADISLKDGLYALNVSAFSGRSGRPEYFNRIVTETLVSPVALAEHKMRQIAYGRNSVRRSVPIHISSPTTAGLFGGLVLRGDPVRFNLLQMLTADLSKDREVYSDRDGISKRVLIGRFEEFPATMVGSAKEMGQLGFVRGIMEMALRLGRPVHVFRGMAQQVRDFVHFDTLPPALASALGGQGLRLEQIKPMVHLLRGLETVAQTPGFGLELAMAIADPETRFAALCDALSRADRREEVGIKLFALNILKEGKTMKENHRSIVAFAEAMANYQKAPNRDDGTNVTERGFRIALEQAELLQAQGLDGEEQLVAAIAGSVKAEYERGKLTFLRNGDDALRNAAEVFVKEVWLGAFKGVSPNSRLRRTVMAIYRWSFVTAVNARVAGHKKQAEATTHQPIERA